MPTVAGWVASATCFGLVALVLWGAWPTTFAAPAPDTALSVDAQLHPAVQTGPTPPPMERAAVAYDAGDSAVLLFGGQEWNNQVLGTTWTFSHGSWTNLTSGLSNLPPARWGAAMAYDAADGETILFGGCPSLSCGTALNDTWAYAHGRWSDLTPLQNRSPPARDLASMAYDAKTGALLLFGGQPASSSSTSLNDTWQFRSGQWSPVTGGPSPVAPTGRFDAGMAFDPGMNSVVLFGGVSTTGGGAVLGDTWGFSQGNWSQLYSGSPAPSPRRGSVFVYDAGDGVGLLVGGYNQGSYYGDVWTLGTAGWSQLATSGSAPQAAFGAMAADDVADGYVVVFSGQDSRGYQSDTWDYSHGTWTTLVAPSPAGASALGSLLLFQLAFVVPIVLVALFATVIVQFRMRRRPQGFDVRPGDPVRWVPSRGGANQYAQALLVPLLLSVFLIPVDLSFAATGALTLLGVLLFLVLPLLVIFLVFVAVARSAAIRSVGVAPGGIVLQRSGYQQRIAWDDVSLPEFPVRNRGFILRYTAPAQATGGGFVRVSLEQARAILTSPYAPAWPISTSISRTVGVPARGTPSAPTAPLAPTSRLPSAHAAPGSVAAPPPPPSGWSTPPPPPPPVPPAAPPAVQPVVIAPPVPLYQVRCTGCGSTFPVGKYAFCPSCGRRIA